MHHCRVSDDACIHELATRLTGPVEQLPGELIDCSPNDVGELLPTVGMTVSMLEAADDILPVRDLGIGHACGTQVLPGSEIEEVRRDLGGAEIDRKPDRIGVGRTQADEAVVTHECRHRPRVVTQRTTDRSDHGQIGLGHGDTVLLGQCVDDPVQIRSRIDQRRCLHGDGVGGNDRIQLDWHGHACHLEPWP